MISEIIMVDVHLHRKGLGSKLLAYTETQLFNNGDTVIRLETFEDNQQAINFYKKNKWSIARKEEDKENGFVLVFFEKHT